MSDQQKSLPFASSFTQLAVEEAITLVPEEIRDLVEDQKWIVVQVSEFAVQAVCKHLMIHMRTHDEVHGTNASGVLSNVLWNYGIEEDPEQWL